MLEYQKTGRFFGMISEDLKQLGEEELKSFGASRLKKVYRGIFFECDLKTLYRVNYMSRFFSRILAPILTFDCHSDRYLYSTAKKIDWSQFLTEEDTFAVFASVHGSKIRHSKYAALKLKDAVADWFTENRDSRPSVDTRYPDVWLGLRIYRNRAYLRLDTSGGALHRRGYREESVTAPMQETLAAAIVELSGWDGSRRFYDPFCGSGTLLCEAHAKYCNIPSGHLRKKFGFQHLPDFDPNEWSRLKSSIDSEIRELPPGLIAGSDISQKAVEASRRNCLRLPGGDAIELIRADFKDIDELKNSHIVTNPPYGIRLKSKAEAKTMVRSFGDFLKQRCTGSSAWIYFGKRELIKSVGLKTSRKIPLHSGKLDGRLVNYEIY
ncbi:MAG: class I SAM-dependent RNA methyltransferase [Candidatus Aegiribacteria sp.]|nr:class I SAM-dependent RNA methyltransferase [Candidatus Aegiribacteria sp.]MBD3295052.1 class I SAM-dependent RNA methyltransferase [Candidatus Fermentibacteria bacterium]